MAFVRENGFFMHIYAVCSTATQVHHTIKQYYVYEKDKNLLFSWISLLVIFIDGKSDKYQRRRTSELDISIEKASRSNSKKEYECTYNRDDLVQISLVWHIFSRLGSRYHTENTSTSTKLDGFCCVKSTAVRRLKICQIRLYTVRLSKTFSIFLKKE